MALSPKHARFVAEYLKDLNATQACIRAGYSAKTAKQQGSRLLTNAAVKAAIGAKGQQVTAKAEVQTEEVLRELQRIGYSDIGALLAPDGSFLPLAKMPEDVRRAIASVEVEEVASDDMLDDGAPVPPKSRVVKIKFWDKPKALEMLAKHKALFVDRVVHSADESFAALVSASLTKGAA